VRVLEANGCDVIVPKGQWCCGALNVHAGERRYAAEMAARNLRAFGAVELDAIVVNAAGCGAVMKEYAELLERGAGAEAFAGKVKDVNEFLASLELRRPQRPLKARVTYQDACHLAHGQKIRRQPRELLKLIPGIEFVEMSGADECCGAAGVYGLTHPQLAGQILERKLEQIAATNADVVATSNPGCALQLEAGLRSRGSRTRVCHVVELLAEAY
jgi:glycolate oxidase iron-sulfur subunit